MKLFTLSNVLLILAAGPISDARAAWPGSLSSDGELVFFNESNAAPTVIQFSPAVGSAPPQPRNQVFLVDISESASLGEAEIDVVHQWPSDLEVAEGSSSYLTPDGYALVSGFDFPGFLPIDGVTPATAAPVAHAVGAHGIIRLLEPDGNIVWQYVKCDYDEVVDDVTGDIVGLSAGDECLHHDMDAMENGHIIVTAFKKRSKEEILAKGYDRSVIVGDGYDPDAFPTPEYLWVEKLYELEPVFGPGAEFRCQQLGLPWSEAAPYCTQIVWELDLFDYFGDDPFNPNVININYTGWDAAANFGGLLNNQIHVNGISYSEVRNEIAMTSISYNEVFVFARNSKELVYRWGQPRNYACEEENPERCGQFLQGPHDVNWVESDSFFDQLFVPTLTIHNNAAGTSPPNTDDPDCADGPCAKVIQLQPTVDARGGYVLSEGQFGPFPYEAETPAYTVLYGPFATIFASGAQLFQNGDVLLTKSNSRELRRVAVTVPPGGDRGSTDPNGDWIWSTASMPFLEQVVDPDTRTYQEPDCVDLTGSPVSFLGVSCSQIFKARILDERSRNILNFRFLRGDFDIQ